MRKLIVSGDLGLSNEKILLISDFCNFCSKFLNITNPFKVYVVADRKRHGIETTAFYQRGDGIIKIYGKNRAIVDVCRSIAHELVHHMQDENDMLVGVIQDAGGDIEDEANAKAGEIIKRFAKSNPARAVIYERKMIL
tara:strand:- start:2293 stop:2706 length:414 start_codon:yes stop_codon:yes gene_type:complete